MMGGMAGEMLGVMVLGGVGSVLRWGVSSWVGGEWGTVVVNWIGSLLMGLVMGYCERRGVGYSPMVVAGLLGGFTTFSALSRDVVLLAKKSVWLGGGMAVVTMVGGIVCAWGGYLVTKSIH